MTSHKAPEVPEGESGVLHSSSAQESSTASPSTAIFTRVWFWALILCGFWVFPLYKSINVDFPDPVPGFDRQAEVFTLQAESGEEVTCADLAGHLLVIQSLDFGSPDSAEREFTSFRERKKRLRGLGSLLIHVILVQNAQPGPLAAFLDEKTARKPNNLFLLDEGGLTLAALRASASSPGADDVIVLDRHGRLRGAYGLTEAEGNRMAQDMGSLGNWLGSDPELGQPVSH